ncbi:MAG: BatD family protein [Kiritimatiellia bacterium]
MTLNDKTRNVRLGALGAIALLSLAVSGYSQPSVSFDIQPRALRVGEAAQCTITVRGADNPQAPALPRMDGFQISGPGRSQQSSFNMVNGRMEADSSVTFNYSLMPLKPGNFTIGPFEYQLGTQRAQLPAIELQVIEPEGGGDREALYAEITSARENPFVQEVFDLYISVYAHESINLHREINLLGFDTAGLDMKGFQELGQAREVVDNTPFNVRRFRAKVRALRSGDFSLNPVLRAHVIVQREQRRDPFNDPFFGGFFNRQETRAVDLAVNPLSLQVRPLPDDGKPVSFSGAVGRFDFQVTAQPLKLAVGDPITLTMSVSGEGNLDGVTVPEPGIGEHFRAYNMKQISRNLDKNSAAGQLVYEQVLLPQNINAKELPALDFTFFDPQQEKYVTVSRGPFPLELSPAVNGASRMVDGAARAANSGAKVLGSDIVYLKPAPRAPVRNAPRSRGFWLMQAIPALCAGGLFLFTRRRRELNQNIAKARRIHAPRSARKGLKIMDDAMRANDGARFTEGLWEALTRYFGNLLNLAPGEVTADIVVQRLGNCGLPAESTRDIADIFRACESMRYAPGQGITTSDMAEMKIRLGRILKACERIKT